MRRRSTTAKRRRSTSIRDRLHGVRAEFAAVITSPTSKLIDLAGGWHGLVDALVPHTLFLVIYLATRQIGPAVCVAVALAVVMAVIRLLSRQPLRTAVAGAALIGVSALVVVSTGDGTDFYLLDIARTSVMSVILVASLVVRRPLVGVLVGPVIGDARWYSDSVQRRAYDLCTVIWAAAVVVRCAVKIPFYLDDNVAALGIASMVMGVPLLVVTTYLQLRILRAMYSRRVTARSTLDTAP
ncbi:hypothetical protein Y900_013010 [Mycolicibacterium aromaticivorans JS19b1 = JCM 16368]|uniref:DUF3159 domain-containing protein n=1 Tax=Mycolicibacterium aromaticivorans JS19b1 = JCM 16368 TaxID=1440774 RepID=A0A064CGZ0_9MYCO|nr:DUF3159 domain-containing protein [Mycolicibacterium aromaticivorans]KDE99829.1 hypothetical protein Y900_013010 [Mycolicibacterium aromaticivorans JS19b1 = JCM 16368]